MKCVGLLIAVVPCLAAERQPAPVYPNSKVIQASCDAVWPATVATVTQRGFVPALSDRASGVLRADSGDQSKYRGATMDMNALTVNRSNFFTRPDRFMIQDVVATIVPVSSGCSVTVQVRYAALKVDHIESFANAIEDGLIGCRLCPSRPLARNWVRLQSNGRLESAMLAQIEGAVPHPEQTESADSETTEVAPKDFGEIDRTLARPEKSVSQMKPPPPPQPAQKQTAPAEKPADPPSEPVRKDPWLIKVH